MTNDFASTATLPRPIAAAPPAAVPRLAGLLSAAERLLDVVTVVAALYFAGGVNALLHRQALATMQNVGALTSAAAFAMLFVILLERHGAYRNSVSLLGIRETERILRVTVQSFLLAGLAVYFAAVRVPRSLVVCGFVTVPLSVILGKMAAYRFTRLLRSRRKVARQAVIFGTGEMARAIYSALLRSPKVGLNPVAMVSESAEISAEQIYESWYQREHPAKVVPGPLSAELLLELKADVLILSVPGLGRDHFRELMEYAAEAGAGAYFLPESLTGPDRALDYDELDGNLLAHFSAATPRVGYEIGKRVMDLLVCGAVLVLFGWLLALIAALVMLTSAGPVLFIQERVGKDGALFSMYKFRTMYSNTPSYERSPTSGDDPRITTLGRFLRRTSLDELPQLFNVLLGEMSLVGPRPEMPFIVQGYTARQRRRLAAKPGITGLWQLSADRKSPIHQNLEYDDYYLTNNPQFVWRIGLQLSGVKKFDPG